MEDSDLDLSKFEADMVNYYLAGAARARLFQDSVAGRPWKVDLAKGELELGNKKFTVQVLGTYAENYFLWSWKNPDAKDWTKSLTLANKLHSKGKKPGYAVFREGKVSPKWVTPEEIAYVAGEISGRFPAYFAPQGEVAVVLLITSASVDIEKLPVVYISGLILDLPPTMPNPRSAIGIFAEGLGFTVDEKEESLTANREDASFTVTFNKEGQVNEVSLEASPPKPSKPARHAGRGITKRTTRTRRGKM